MPSWEIVCVVLFAAAGWFWLHSLRVREAAVRGARDACAMEGLLLLDDTVAIAAMKPVRDSEGRRALQRVYEFEFSDTGNNRLKGSVVLVGRKVVMFNVGVRESPEVRRLH
jgi:hypothetical protein